MVDQVDADGSGSIEFLEFLLLMGRMIKDIPSDNDLRDIFVGKFFCLFWKLKFNNENVSKQ